MGKKDKLEITKATRKVIVDYGLDPTKMTFWREGLTAYASYKAGFRKTVKASTDIEEYSSNAGLMIQLCEDIINSMRK